MAVGQESWATAPAALRIHPVADPIGTGRERGRETAVFELRVAGVFCVDRDSADHARLAPEDDLAGHGVFTRMLAAVRAGDREKPLDLAAWPGAPRSGARERWRPGKECTSQPDDTCAQ